MSLTELPNGSNPRNVGVWVNALSPEGVNTDQPKDFVERFHLRQAALDDAYASVLASLDRTDTLVAVASRGNN